jgi:hypothetical protein
MRKRQSLKSILFSLSIGLKQALKSLADLQPSARDKQTDLSGFFWFKYKHLTKTWHDGSRLAVSCSSKSHPVKSIIKRSKHKNNIIIDHSDLFIIVYSPG